MKRKLLTIFRDSISNPEVKILTGKFICRRQDLLFAGMQTKYFKGKKMVARAGIDKEGTPDDEPERSDGNPHTVSSPFFDQREKNYCKKKKA